MTTPDLVFTDMIGGEPTAWKCSACNEPFDLSAYPGTTEQKMVQMLIDYTRHCRSSHLIENA